ncbi:MAG: hypothetical protein FJ276_03255 [Planctomycetes bacterium]|nr:hypothetical protein [Planctomycetota bacterium]
MARQKWLDDNARTTLIDDYASELGAFVDAMADGKVDAGEVAAQEQRVVDLMKTVEPRLDDAMHEQITKLLCEMSALSVMQTLHALYEARPKSKFQG